MSKHKVYLAGPISGLDYEGCTSWREYARDRLADYGINGVSPMRGKEFLSRIQGGLSKTGEDYGPHPFAQPQGILARDRFDCTTCDVLLVNLAHAVDVSIGTMFEMAWAHINRTPIVLVMEDGNLHEHIFVNQTADFRVDDLDDAIDLVKAILR